MKNWKTTLFGALAAAVVALQNYSGHNTWQGYLSAAMVAAFGYLAKDYDQ